MLWKGYPWSNQATNSFWLSCAHQSLGTIINIWEVLDQSKLNRTDYFWTLVLTLSLCNKPHMRLSGGDRTGLWEDMLFFKLLKVTTLLGTSICYSLNK